MSTTQTLNIQETFGIEQTGDVMAYQHPNEFVPTVDPDYYFHGATTQAILAGFQYNRRVLLQGMHGTGKSSHIEQIAARLNWPCMRVNLDGNISRLDLVGKDTLTLEDGKQVTAFQEGIIPWAMQQPMALVFDEYDAGRPEVMFVIQRLLEAQGEFAMLDKNKVIKAHPAFRLFATANTVGLGNTQGLYHGTNVLNQAQIDRWHIVAKLDYLPQTQEVSLLKRSEPQSTLTDEVLAQMVALANLTRNAFKVGDLSTLMSLRTLTHWIQNEPIFGSLEEAFTLTFLNKCDVNEKPLIEELYQRVFDRPLDEESA